MVVLPAAGAAQRSGVAIIVAHSGQVRARYPVGTIHEGRSEAQPLFKGASVGERATLTTGRDGHLCIVLSPGALLHVAPGTQLYIERLRHTAQGLPRSEADLVRHIELRLESGRIYMDGGVPTPSLIINVQTDAGTVHASGGIFSLAQLDDDAGWRVWCQDHAIEAAVAGGAREPIKAGTAVVLTGDSIEQDTAPHQRHQFELCKGYFRDLEQFRHPIQGFDQVGVSGYIGVPGAPVFLGDAEFVADVSPSVRRADPAATVPFTPTQLGLPDGRRWTQERIWAWWDTIGVIRGVNYIPRNCVNSTEMWMEETFDAEIIDEELGWAKDAGFTAVRVILQHVVWRNDPDGFLERLDTFLKLAERHELAVVPVLFDDLNRAGREPDYGPQPEPVPNVHNAQWVPSPGRSRITDMAQWSWLEDYVRAVVGKFKRDRRILYWDLYNTVGNNGLWEQSLPLMDQVFNWVRDIDPRHPLAVPAWKDFGSPMTARKLERSDIITFHSFDNREMLEPKIVLLERYNRPIVMSDWLMRQRQNTFEEILPILATHGVGWFSHGLVKGRTQQWVQEPAFRSDDNPDLWQHDVLEADGTPYNKKETELIRGFRYHEGN